MPNPDFNPIGLESGPMRPGVAVDPYRVLRALWAGKWWLLAASVVGLVLGFVIAKTFIKSPYTTAALLKYEGALAYVEGLPPPDPGAFAASSQALSMQPVLKDIKERIGFEGNLTALSNLVDYTTDFANGVLRIEVSSASAEGAAAFSKAVAEAFIGYHEKQQSARIAAEMQSIDGRIKAAEVEAARAREAYKAFREEHGIADVGTEQGGARESAAKLKADAQLATSEIRALEARVKTLEEQLAQTSKTRVVTGGRSPELAQYNRLRGELAKARSSLSSEHPRVRSLEAQVEALRQQITSGNIDKTGAGTVTANTTHQALSDQLRTSQTNLESLRERQRSLTELATQAQARAETFSEFEGEASTLLTQIKVNEGLIKELKSTRAYLEDGIGRASSGFVILDPGAVPEYAKRSRTKYFVFAGVPAFFVMIALAFVLGRELRGLRVRTPAEVGFWGHGPVVGSTTWPKDPRGVDDLVAGLDDYAPDARGNILIVGASEREEELACELATRLGEDWVMISDASADPALAEHVPGQSHRPGPIGHYPLAKTQQPYQLATSHPQEMRVEAWVGPSKGQALRRAARLADRVIVLVPSGAISTTELAAMRTRLGRTEGVGYILVGLDDELQHLPDRAGDIDDFWRTSPKG